MNTTNNNPTVKMSKGFTMIELIFVIVIIGILAAVAIPKLSATRDDAKIATATNEVGQVVKEISTYYTSKGTYTAAKLQDVTNVTLYTDAACTTKATAMASATMYYYCTQKSGASTLEPAVTLKPSNVDGSLLIAAGAGTGMIAKGLQASQAYKQVFGNDGNITNGGSRVTF